MVRLAVTFAFVAGTAAARLEGERDLREYSFEQFREEFGQNYNSVEEKQIRKEIFTRNLAMINEHNSMEDKTWFATVNEFTAWTNEEFRAQRTGHSPHPPQLQLKKLENLPVHLPDAVDWRNNGSIMTPVKNQGSCGSCWAFSATETLESHYAIATGEDAPVLSPQQIVSCAPNPNKCGGSGGCDGSTQPLAFNYTESSGITLDDSYPYRGSTGTCDQSKIKPVAQNSGYTVLQENNYTDLITAVANVGPVSISVAAGGMGWQLYGGGVYSDSGSIHPFLCNFDMDHAVQLVGYGTDNDKLYWLVRNSWGGGWGESGYIRVERHGEGKEPCGTDKTPQDGDACAGDTKPRTYCGLCGILSSSSFPTGLHKVGSIEV